MKKYLMALAAMTCAGFVAAQGSDSVDHDFSSCLWKEAKDGSFSSFDGGISAVKMVERCETSYVRWVDSCRARSTTNDCVTKAAVLAQAALKINGK